MVESFEQLNMATEHEPGLSQGCRGEKYAQQTGTINSFSVLHALPSL